MRIHNVMLIVIYEYSYCSKDVEYKEFYNNQ